MPKRKARKAGAELARALNKAKAGRAAREETRTAALADKGKELWPQFLGTPREQAIVEFFEHWTPERVLDVWRAELRAYGLDASTVVQFIPISRNGRSQVAGGHPPSGTAWWPKYKVAPLRASVLRWLDENPDVLFVPDAVMRPGVITERSGLARTVETLAEVGADPHRVGAVLIAASLFSRAVSSRPLRDWQLEQCIGLLLYHWMLKLVSPGWHVASSSTLPNEHFGFGADIDEMGQLISILAVEHARVLHGFVPVCVKFVDEQPPPALRLLE